MAVIKKIAGVTKANTKKISSVSNVPISVDGSVLEDAYLKSFHNFTASALDSSGNGYGFVTNGSPTYAAAVFGNGITFNGSNYAFLGDEPNYYWKMEGNANGTFGGVNGTSTDVTYGANYGLYGQGGLFNGSSSKITLNTTALDVGTGDFAVSFAFKTTQTDANYRAILSKGGAGTEGWNVWMRSGTMRINMDDGTNVQYTLPFENVCDGEWHQYVISVDRNVGASCYMDGVDIGDVDITGSSGSLTNANSSTIGCYYGGSWFTDGSIDNVAFWSNTLPINIAIPLSNTEHLDGWKPTGSFTVSSWVKTTTTSANYFAQAYSDNTIRAGWLIGTTAAGLFQFYIGINSADTFNSVNSIKTVNDNVWHLCTAVYDGSKMKVYVDGKLDNEEDWSTPAGYAATTYLRIGCFCSAGTNASFYTGSLDDLAIWNRALSADEVLYLYTRTKKVAGLTTV